MHNKKLVKYLSMSNNNTRNIPNIPGKGLTVNKKDDKLHNVKKMNDMEPLYSSVI